MMADSKEKMVRVRNLYKGSKAFCGIPYLGEGEVPESYLRRNPGCWELVVSPAPKPEPAPEPEPEPEKKAPAKKRRRAKKVED